MEKIYRGGNEMTKKIFKQLAKVVKELDIETEKKIELARKLANVCTMYNPRFDRERFFEACGLVEKWFDLD